MKILFTDIPLLCPFIFAGFPAERWSRKTAGVRYTPSLEKQEYMRKGVVVTVDDAVADMRDLWVYEVDDAGNYYRHRQTPRPYGR